MAANPTLLLVPIAQNGTKNTIPQNQATPGNGLMSQSTGFPAECSLPLGAGGVAPDRADFNGAFNLLGGVAFMAQKGFTFNYDATQDYYKGCVVIDPNDGNRYLCIADMTAGTVAPSADTAHTYWTFYPVGVINKRDVITTSGTYTAPVTGWYRITVKGGGGGGSSGRYTSTTAITGSGGGEGGTTIGFEKMTAGQTATVVIGAGGSGGAAPTAPNVGNVGGAGGNSSVTVNGNTYTGGGSSAHSGGTGNIPGASGGALYITEGIDGVLGGAGGGAGGSFNSSTVSDSPSAKPSSGGGGAGGAAVKNSVARGGGNGAAGFVWFEYFSPSLT